MTCSCHSLRGARMPRRNRPTSTPSRRSSRKQTDSANYLRRGMDGSAAELLIDKAQQLTLSAPEMTVLVGGVARAGCECGRIVTRRLHEAPRGADQRLLRQLARHADEVAAVANGPERAGRP